MFLKKCIPWWVFIAFAFFAPFTVWLRLSIIRTTYDLNTAHIHIQKLKQKKIALENTLHQLKNPLHLQKIAQQEFSMHPPASHQIFILSEPHATP